MDLVDAPPVTTNEVKMARRNVVGLFFISVIFGAPSVFLWLSRARLAFIYFAVTIASLIVWFLMMIQGKVSLSLFQVMEGGDVAKIPALAVSLIAFVHAWRLNKRPSPRYWYSRWYVAFFALLATALLVAFIVRTFLYQPFSIPSSSNEPNLMQGDYVFVSKTRYLNAVPQRGDIAVFKLPKDPKIDYVKRVIGLPGDRIQMKAGRLFINGQEVPREQVSLPDNYHRHANSQFYREVLPGGHSILIGEKSDSETADNTDEYLVPEDHYFVMGDSRDNSMDSRFEQTGYIPRQNFVGPVVLLFWNSRGFPLDDRPGGF